MKEASHNNAASHVWSKRHHLKYMVVVHVAAINTGTAASMQAAAATRRSSDVLTTYVRTRAKHYLRGKYITLFSLKKEVQEKESAVIQVLSVPQLITHIAIHLLNENSLFFFKCQKHLI